MDKILIGREYIEEVMINIRKEKESIDLCIYELYHKQSTKLNNVNYLVEHLLNKGYGGVKIRAIVNQTLANNKNKENLERLKWSIQNAGGKVVEIKKGILMHSKAIQFGKSYIIVGSHNLSDRSFKSHYEISIATDSLEVNQKFSRWYEQFF